RRGTAAARPGPRRRRRPRRRPGPPSSRPPSRRVWLLAPLVAGASTVLCANADPARLPARAETERVTRTLA
ncbi:hypothetical protein AB0B99_11540, partial [Micromonospora haikouensis]